MKVINFLRSLFALTLGRQQQRAIGILQLLEMDALTLTELYEKTRFRKMEIAKILSQLMLDGKVAARNRFRQLPGHPPRPQIEYTLTGKGKEFLEERRK